MNVRDKTDIDRALREAEQALNELSSFANGLIAHIDGGAWEHAQASVNNLHNRAIGGIRGARRAAQRISGDLA
jgi:hypothetical protein